MSRCQPAPLGMNARYGLAEGFGLLVEHMVRDESVDEPRRGYGRLILAGVAVAALSAVGVYTVLRLGTGTPTSGGSPPPSATASAAPLAVVPVPDAPPPTRPPAEGDALLRQLAAGWSTDPELARWLAAESLVQRLAAAAVLVSKGASPRPMLGFVELRGAFVVDEQLGQAPGRTPGAGADVVERDFIAPAAYARYDLITRLVTGVDPGSAARAYRQLSPYLEGAFAQIAQPGERFDAVLRAAIERLRAVPVPAGPVEVVPKGAPYLYADAALEARPPAEKQLLRFGPTNQAALQAWLGRFADAVVGR